MSSDETQLFGVKTEDSDISSNPLVTHLKRFLNGISGISSELKEWCSKGILPGVATKIQQPVVTQPTTLPSSPFSTAIVGQRSFSNLSSSTTYDISNDRMLSYEDLQKLTLSIARQQLTPGTQRDETVIALEKEARRNLINEIMEFKNVKKINPFIEDDLQSLSIDQLKTVRDKCENYHSRFKVDEVLKSGFNLCSIGYDVLFPDGIPLTEGKKLKFGGVGKEIRDKIFDSRNTVGFSFSRMLSKYNIKVTDEFTVMMAIGETIISQAKVVNVEPESKDRKENQKDKNETVKPTKVEEEDDELEEV